MNTEKYLVDNAAQLKKYTVSLKALFTKIDEVRKTLLNVPHTDIETIKDLLLKFTGYYSYINEQFAKLSSLKKNKALAYYYNARVESEKNGDKFVSAPVEKESEFAVATEREMRDMAEAYVATCMEGIRTCRVLINNDSQVPSVD